MNLKKKCKCEKRWMNVFLGDIHYGDDQRTIENLTHFVDSCECMATNKGKNGRKRS